MKVTKHILQDYISHQWDKNLRKRQRGCSRNWWDSSLLRSYIASRICAQYETGVVGALREALEEGSTISKAISIGAGSGNKELALISAGLVEHFDLYEISPVRVDVARQNANAAGLSDRVTVHKEDAFARLHEHPYDLVYWDHALHHMMDVNKAVSWSVGALSPGGLLLINDYVGPTRLQWKRTEVQLARKFIREAKEKFQIDLPYVSYRTMVSRLRMMWRDPSEAPQSDRIIMACQQHCQGFTPSLIGGALINICGPAIGAACPTDGPVHSLLIEWDQRAEAEGLSHFAFGIWRKPI